MRKIVTTKDFEFSPRKESAAAEPASPPSLACACIMHAQRRCEKNVLAAAKRGVVALSLCMRYQPRYTAVYRMQVRVSISEGPDARNFAGGPLIVLMRFSNYDPVSCNASGGWRCNDVKKIISLSKIIPKQVKIMLFPTMILSMP